MKIILETDRLYLRQFTPQDGDNLFELDSDPAVMRFITQGKATDYAVIQTEVLPRFLAYYDRPDGYGFWAIEEKASQSFLGWVCLRPAADHRCYHPVMGAPDDGELGYRLRRSAWGQGYATEAARAVLRRGFTELGSRRIIAHSMVENLASQRVMLKVGLQFQTHFVYDGLGWQAALYALKQGEWSTANCPH